MMKNAAITVALILDALSPKTGQLLRQNFTAAKRVGVFSLHARDSVRGKSSCDFVPEKFVLPGPAQAAVLKSVTPDAQAQVPVALALRKIQFDLDFGLHEIQEIIINAPLRGGKDSCGEDVCQGVLKLERVARRKGQRIRIQSLTPLSCTLPANSAVILEQANGESAAQIARNALSPLPAAHGGRKKTELARKAEGSSSEHARNQTTTLDLIGPPIQFKLILRGGKSEPVTVQAPQSVELEPGTWKFEVSEPSWLTGIPGFTVEIKAGGRRTVRIKTELESQVEWIPASTQHDRVVTLESRPGEHFPPRVLLPRGSDPLPVPKGTTWKAYDDPGT